MAFASVLLKAPHVGVRELKAHLSAFLRKKDAVVITDRGVPVDVLLPYDEALELADMLDEMNDPGTLRAVAQGRRAAGSGAAGVPVSRIFEKLRKSRS